MCQTRKWPTSFDQLISDRELRHRCTDASRFRTAVIVRVNNQRWISEGAPVALFHRVATGLLCDLQAGISFLFVDQLAVPAPSTLSSSRNRQIAGPAGVVPVMAAGSAKLRFAIGIVVLALSSHSVAALTFDATDDLFLDPRPARSPAASAIPEEPAAPAQAGEAPLAPIQGRTRANNPLWVIPLAALSGTRERPIFSSSRRPSAPAVALAPVVKPAAVAPKPKDPERPKLSLVGTIASDHGTFGIFLDQSTKAALLLKMGDDFQGWKLQSVQGREAILEKDQQAVIVALPEPGAIQPASDVRPPLSSAGTLLSARRERSSH